MMFVSPLLTLRPLTLLLLLRLMPMPDMLLRELPLLTLTSPVEPMPILDLPPLKRLLLMLSRMLELMLMHILLLIKLPPLMLLLPLELRLMPTTLNQ